MQRRQFTQVAIAAAAVSSLSAVALLSNTTAQAQAAKGCGLLGFRQNCAY
jgi:hypothetical protein